jgi:hypothetical protein
MDVFQQYATDEKKEVEGVWVDLNDKGARVLVARAGNKKYARLFSREYEKHQRALESKTDEADALSDKLVVEIMAEAILLNWEGLSFKGQSLPYSKENARKLLGVKDFRTHISKVSNDFDAYRVAQEQAAGNA